jgi:Holliday junction resolvase-like predicted endonuclease
MDINVQQTPVDEPVAELHVAVLDEIVTVVRKQFRGDTDSVSPKDVLNAAYNIALEQLHKILDSRNSASWMLEAYKQMFMWTAVYRKELTPWQHFDASEGLAPIGRYGWRYAIDYSLSKSNSQSLQNTKPNYEDVSKVFSILAVMTISAEWSNLIHYFPDVYGDVRFDLSSPEGILFPLLTEDALSKISLRSNYMLKREHQAWEKFAGTDDDFANEYVKLTLSSALKESKGFDLAQLEKFIDILLHNVLSSGLVLIIPGGYLIDWISEEGYIAKNMAVKILDFMLLSSSALVDTNRNFLNKKDQVRMINFAGVRIDRLKNLKSIYPKESVHKPHIKKASWHVIINIFMVGEWYDTFMHRCLVGQRQDLKLDPILNRALEDIEQYQRRNVFESLVGEIFSSHGFQYVKGLKKWPNKQGQLVMLPCGEIDVLAYHGASRTLFVVECKAGAPAIDSRGYSQQFKDHFEQKKYHFKFQSKISWVNENVNEFSHLESLGGGIVGCSPVQIVPVLVTRYPSIIKFYVDDYKVMTFAELDESLDGFVTGL